MAKRSHANMAEYQIYKSQSLEANLTPPLTPPGLDSSVKFIHTWPEPEIAPDEITESPARRRKIDSNTRLDILHGFNASRQDVLLLHGVKQRYTLTKEQPVPELKDDREMLVAVEAIGLNPIDWKAPDFGFGLPQLPCISGRDLAGKVVKLPKIHSRFKTGDRIMAISTDYRDSRKAAYQQYTVVPDFNACRLPSHLSVEDAAPLGVAFVAAVLALGVCLGLDFVAASGGPNLLRIVRSLPPEALPADIRKECLEGIGEGEKARPGDWIAIWGGSSATGCCAVQLAKLCGLKVLAIVDVARSGERMLRYGADLLVDRLDTERAISIVKGITKGRLRFGLDTRGKESASLLAEAMKFEGPDHGLRSHLVGLTGCPKEPTEGVVYHSVPIKVFHEAPEVGSSLTLWLEKLLERKQLATPDIEIAEGGLEGINSALDRLRDGSVNGPRLVVPLPTAV